VLLLICLFKLLNTVDKFGCFFDIDFSSPHVSLMSSYAATHIFCHLQYALITTVKSYCSLSSAATFITYTVLAGTLNHAQFNQCCIHVLSSVTCSVTVSQIILSSLTFSESFSQRLSILRNISTPQLTKLSTYL